jgi:hypothetical protein
MCDFWVGWSAALVIWYMQGLLTPVLALVAGYIAWRQWRTSAQRLRLDLYEKRYRVFGEVKNILVLVLKKADVTPDEIMRFRAATSDAVFLFGDEVRDFVKDLADHALALWNANARYAAHFQNKEMDYDPKKTAEEMDRHLGWFTDLVTAKFPEVEEKFSRYLDVSKL